MNMRINSNQNIYSNRSFKGYDARPLKGVLMTVSNSDSYTIISQISNIGKKNGFKVYFTDGSKRIYSSLSAIGKRIQDKTKEIYTKWAQDSAVLTPQNKIIASTSHDDRIIAEKIAKLTGGEVSFPQEFTAGGNLFFVKNGGKEELFIGADETYRKENLKKIYGVSDVHVIPQADFHLDLFIRPLNNKIILVADDNSTIKELQTALKNLNLYKKNNKCSEVEHRHLEKVKSGLTSLLNEFKKESTANKNPKYKELAQKILHAGFTPVPIPGRIYYTVPGAERDDLVHSLNYMNALVHQKKDGSLVFITNKSNLNNELNITPQISEIIDFDFEKMLKKALKPYIKEDDIHFIGGNQISELLTDEEGGIHCLCNEIPADLKSH